MTRYYRHILSVIGLCILIFSIIQKEAETESSQNVSENVSEYIQVHQQEEGVWIDPAANLVTVTKVIDGDTIKIQDGEMAKTIRLIGINTPELRDTRSNVKCMAEVAKRKAEELLLNQKIQIQSDPSQGDVDKYGRTLGYIVRDDGLFFNKYMITEGYAYEYTYRTAYKFQSEFKQAQKEAENQSRGLWATTTCKVI